MIHLKLKPAFHFTNPLIFFISSLIFGNMIQHENLFGLMDDEILPECKEKDPRTSLIISRFFRSGNLSCNNPRAIMGAMDLIP